MLNPALERDAEPPVPETPAGLLGRAAALKQSGSLIDMEACLARGFELFPSDLAIAQAYAVAAEGRGDATEALRRWGAVKLRHPGSVDAYVHVAELLSGLGRFDEADAVLAPAVRAFPDDFRTQSLFATIASQRGDLAVAIQRWSRVNASFPQQWLAHLQHAAALAQNERFTESEAVLKAAIALFPDNSRLAADYARLAEHQSKAAVAVERWRRVRQHHDLFATSTAAIIVQLQLAGNNDGADSEAESALERLPNDPEILTSYALLAVRRRDWREARRRWLLFQQRLPHHSVGYAGLGSLLGETGAYEEADQLLNEALLRFPADWDLAFQRAYIASQARNWARALPYWAALKASHPHRHDLASPIDHFVGQARLDLQTLGADAVPFTIPAILEASIGSGTRAQTRDVLLQFESLGADCEFGMVQRRFGAEPLNLLRWSTIPVAALVRALDERFAALDDIGEIELRTEHSELILRVDRYSLAGHTFTFENTVDENTFYKQQCRRMLFLRDKLLGELEVGEKIFVFKTVPEITEAEVLRLSEAVSTYNRDATLLYVRKCDDAHSAGTVDFLAPSLAVGYLSWFSTSDIAISDWVAICTTVWDERQRRSVEAQDAFELSAG